MEKVNRLNFLPTDIARGIGRGIWSGLKGVWNKARSLTSKRSEEPSETFKNIKLRTIVNPSSFGLKSGDEVWTTQEFNHGFERTADECILPKQKATLLFITTHNQAWIVKANGERVQIRASALTNGNSRFGN